MAKTIALRSYSPDFSVILLTKYASLPTSDSKSSYYILSDLICLDYSYD